MSIDSKCKIFGRWWEGGGSRRETEKQSCERVHQDKWLRELVGGLQIKRLLLQLLRKLRVVKSSSQNTKINAWAKTTKHCQEPKIVTGLKYQESSKFQKVCNKQRKCRFLYERKEQSDTWTNVFGPSRWLSCYHLYGKRWSKENQSFISCLRFYFRSCQKQLTGNICWLYRREHWLGLMQWRLLMAPVPWCGTSSSSQLWLGNNQNVMNDPKLPKQRWTRPLSRSSSLQTE